MKIFYLLVACALPGAALGDSGQTNRDKIWHCGAESDTYFVSYLTYTSSFNISLNAEPRPKLIGSYQCEPSSGKLVCRQCEPDSELPCDASYSGTFMESEQKAVVLKGGAPVAELHCKKLPPPPPTPNPAWADRLDGLEIEGTWTAPCQPGGEMDTITVRGNLFIMEKKFFNDKECITGLDVTQNIKGLFKIGLDSEKVPNAKNTELMYSSMTATLNFEKLVDYMNSTMYCGYTDWELNKPKNILGRKCITKKMPNLAEKNFGLISLVKPNQFFLGRETDLFDGSTIESRPRELNLQNPYIKQRHRIQSLN